MLIHPQLPQETSQIRHYQMGDRQPRLARPLEICGFARVVKPHEMAWAVGVTKFSSHFAARSEPSANRFPPFVQKLLQAILYPDQSGDYRYLSAIGRHNSF